MPPPLGRLAAASPTAMRPRVALAWRCLYLRVTLWAAVGARARAAGRTLRCATGARLSMAYLMSIRLCKGIHIHIYIHIYAHLGVTLWASDGARARVAARVLRCTAGAHPTC